MAIETYKPVDPQKTAPAGSFVPATVQTYKSSEPEEEILDWKKVFAYLDIIKRRKFIIIQVVSIVLLVAFINTKMQTPMYKASSKVMILPNPVEIYRYGQNETTIYKPQLSIDSQIEMMRSSQVGENISKLLKEKNKLIVSSGEVMASMSITPQKSSEQYGRSEIVIINVSNKDPKLAQLIADYGAEQFKERSRNFDSAKMRSAKELIEEQLYIVEKDLKNAEDRLQNFQKKEGLIDVDSVVKAKVEKVIELEATKSLAEVEKDVAEAKMKEVQSGLGGALRIDEKDPLVAQLQGQLAQLEIELAGLKEKWADDYPDVLNTKAKIAETKKKLSEAIASQSSNIKNQALLDHAVNYTGAEAKNAELTAMFNEETEKLKTLPGKIVEMKRLMREVDVAETKYKSLLQKSQEAKLQETTQQGNVEVAAYAMLPGGPYTPNMNKNLTKALIVGLFMGFILALAVEQMNIPLSNEEDVQKQLKLSVLETIPRIKFHKKKTESRPLMNRTGETDRKYLHFGEAFRSLRTVLNFSLKDEKVKTMLITSSVPGEGKSTIAANLAISYAQMGKRVLLVEADLLKPTLADLFKLKNGKGVTDYLTMKEISLTDLAYDTEIENLKILCSGKKYKLTSELFESERMKELIKELKENEDLDLVIFDSPPCQAVTDSVILSSMMDKVLRVVATNMNARTVQQSVKFLASADADIIGVVLNKMDTTGSSYYYYKYKYKYGYYYSKDKKESEPKLDDILEDKGKDTPGIEQSKSELVFHSKK
ncbi:MAG: Tyrosine-protein kinase YwqD [bacterium ADurb.Bin363]|nr:MAG: Tyrosine-protein kinase YwqD [bacterium ADurb.Bin363]